MKFLLLLLIYFSISNNSYADFLNPIKKITIDDREVCISIPVLRGDIADEAPGSNARVGYSSAGEDKLAYIMLNGQIIKMLGPTYCSGYGDCLMVKDLTNKGGSRFSKYHTILEYELSYSESIFITFRSKHNAKTPNVFYFGHKKEGEFYSVQKVKFKRTMYSSCEK